MWYYVPSQAPRIPQGAITELSLYTGNSGFGLLARLLFPQVRTICYLDHEAHQAATIVARIQDKTLDDAPVASRIESFSGKPFRGCVDILTASMPCTPHSCAGARKDIKDPRWLWDDTKRVIRETRPKAIFMENVLGFKRVLPIVRPQLEALGYTVDVQFVAAAEVGTTHLRIRVWLLAYSNSEPPRIQPWWRGRKNRSGPSEYRRRCKAMGHPGCVGQCESNPEACPVAWPYSWGAHFVPGLAVGNTDACRRRSQSDDGESPPAAYQPSAPVGNPDRINGRSRKDRTTDIEAAGWTGLGHPGEEMGDTPCSKQQGLRQRGSTGQVSHRRSGPEVGNTDGKQRRQGRPGECPYPQEELAAIERTVSEMGYSYGGGRPKLEECYSQQTDADREASFRRNAFGSGVPLFPPGRSESERRLWASVLEEDLGLCPALPKPEIRGVADGTSGYVDQCRSVGRGLVPLAGAYAMLFMFVRAGLVH